VEEALARGLSERKAIDLLKRTVDMGFLFSWQEKGTYGKRLYATEKPPEFF
jgi:hypothetical protein